MAAKCNVTRYSEDGTRLQVDNIKVGQMMEGVTVTLDAENVLILRDNLPNLKFGNWPMIIFQSTLKHFKEDEAAHHLVILDVVARSSLGTIWAGVGKAKTQPKILLTGESLVTSATHHQPSQAELW